MVRIEFKLFASLSEYLPAHVKGHSIALEVPEGTTIYDLIDRFHVPREQAHLVIRNGVFVPPSERATYTLQEGDALALWPPVAGG